MIETDFDIAFAARLAIREKQIQQTYRPIIAVHKWFARRPGTLFRCLMLAEYGPTPLSEAFYRSHSLDGVRIADPFMGGGTPILEANRLGCDVTGFDINPMSYWIVREELESIDLAEYRKAASTLRTQLATRIGDLYKTECVQCGGLVDAKYFLWVKQRTCPACSASVDLLPGYQISQDKRHPKNVLICPQCGDLNEVADIKNMGECRRCFSELAQSGPATRGKCHCPECGECITYPTPNDGPLSHRLFAIEYYCPKCKPSQKGRFFKRPDDNDLSRVADADSLWGAMCPRFVPDDEIPAGDETTRLHRWGYSRYEELFNSRQRVGLELSCELIEKQQERRIRHALATNLSDLLRYQNMVCRYDVMALKSLDIFSVHGFPVGLIACESNLLGIVNGNGISVGSGGWPNITEKYAKAKAYCDSPFEIRYDGKRKTVVRIADEWIGEHRSEQFMGKSSHFYRKVSLNCQSSTEVELPESSLDGVFTDPPYFGNVQYAELMDFCYVWLRKLVDDPAFKMGSTRHINELTGNATLARTVVHFTEGLSSVFSKMAKALKPGAPLVFTFHHNDLMAYLPVIVAILDSGLICTASLPAPAEMAASIHIHGTKSSIIDSVFVSRSFDTTPTNCTATNPLELAELVRTDLAQLREGNVQPTSGDTRCIVYGQLSRLAIRELADEWDVSAITHKRLDTVREWLERFGSVEAIEAALGEGTAKHEVPV